MNILEIIVLAFVAGMAVLGFRRGFVKKLAPMLSLTLSVASVSVFLPYVTEFLKTETPLYSYIVEQCENIVLKQAVSALTGVSAKDWKSVSQSGTAGSQSGVFRTLSGTSGSQNDNFYLRNDENAGLLSAGKQSGGTAVFCSVLSRDEIRALLEQFGYDGSIIDTLTDEELEQYVQLYIQQYFGSSTDFSASEDGSSGSSGIKGWTALADSLDLSSILNNQNFVLDKNTQMEIIDSLPVPELLKDLLITYNNDEGYERLQADSFQEYVVQFIATAILNVISFIAAVILVHLLIWIVLAALRILSHIPVIRGLDRLAGLALGVLQALFFLWIFFLVLATLQTTEAGQQMMTMVEQSELLSRLYETNLFWRVVLQTAALFR